MAEEGIDHSMILAEVAALVDTHRRTPRLHLNCGSDTVTVLGVTGDRVCQRDGRPARCAAMRRSCVATVCVHVQVCRPDMAGLACRRTALRTAGG